MTPIHELHNEAEQQIYKDLAYQQAAAAGKIELLKEVAAEAEHFEELLRGSLPERFELSVNSYESEAAGAKCYGYLSLWYKQQDSFAAALPILEALGFISWASSDRARSLTRVFSGQHPNFDDLEVKIYWEVAEVNNSGCYKRLVKVKEVTETREEEEYEIVCPEAAEATA